MHPARPCASASPSPVTQDGRDHTPVEASKGIWALQNDGQFNQWVRIEGAGQVVPLTTYRRANLIHLAPSPTDETVAVVLNVEGRQGLFQASFDAEGSLTLDPWLLSPGAVTSDTVVAVEPVNMHANTYDPPLDAVAFFRVFGRANCTGASVP